MLEFVFGWARIIFLETLPNNMWWCRFCFLTQRLNYFLQFSSCGPWRVFIHSNSPPHRVLGRYRHTSSSRQFRNIDYVDCKFLIIALMVEMGIFTGLALFLKPLHSFVKLNYLLLHIRNIFFVFAHCDDYGNLGFVFPPIYISVEQDAMAG